MKIDKESIATLYKAMEAETRQCIIDGYAENREALLLVMDGFSTAIQLCEMIQGLEAEPGKVLSFQHAKEVIRELMANHTSILPNGSSNKKQN